MAFSGLRNDRMRTHLYRVSVQAFMPFPPPEGSKPNRFLVTGGIRSLVPSLTLLGFREG